MPTFSDQITDVEVHTGQEAVFSCSVDDGEAPFAWFLNGEKLTENEKYSFKSEKATVKQLTIKDCQLIDDGSVSIQMVPTWGPSSNAKLTVIDGDGLGLGDGDDADGKGLGYGKGRPRITNKDDLTQ